MCSIFIFNWILGFQILFSLLSWGKIVRLGGGGGLLILRFVILYYYSLSEVIWQSFWLKIRCLGASNCHVKTFWPWFLLIHVCSYKLAYSSNYSRILDPLIKNNYQLFIVERVIIMGAKTSIKTFREDETELSLTDDPKKNTKSWQIPVYTMDEEGRWQGLHKEFSDFSTTKLIISTHSHTTQAHSCISES